MSGGPFLMYGLAARFPAVVMMFLGMGGPSGCGIWESWNAREIEENQIRMLR